MSFYLTTALLIIMQVNHLRIFRIFRPLAAMKSKQAPLLLVMRHCRHQRAPLRHLHLPRVKPGWLSLWTSVATLSRHRPPIRPQRLQGRALKLSQRHLQRVDQKLLQNKTSVVSNQTRELPPQRNIFGGRGALWLASGKVAYKNTRTKATREARRPQSDHKSGAESCAHGKLRSRNCSSRGGSGSGSGGVLSGGLLPLAVCLYE